MLKKIVIASALAGAVMTSAVGGANAAIGNGLSKPAPLAQMTSKAAPNSIKVAAKRRFRHGGGNQRRVQIE